MNSRICEISVRPLYGQVSIHDVGTADLPDWETGEEEVVFSAHAVLVATRPDESGNVDIRLVEGSEDPGGREVFDGTISLTSPALEVGSIVAADLTRISLVRPGAVHARIFIEPREAPEVVWVLLDPGTVAPLTRS